MMIRPIFYGSFRSIIKQRNSTTINIIGLSLGIALFLYLLAYARQELTIDSQQPHNIYRVENGEWGILGPGLGPAIGQNIAGVKAVTRLDFFTYSDVLASVGEKKLSIEHFLFADSNFFKTFNFKLLEGEPENVLKEPFSLVLTKKEAKILFGTDHAVGKTITLDNRQTYTVTGIMAQMENSTISVDAIGSFTDIGRIRNDPNFENYITSMWNYPTYVVLKQGVSKLEVEQQLTKWAKELDPEYNYIFTLKPLQDIYFDTSIKYEVGSKHGNKDLVYLFLVVGSLILLLACANYINLATAMAINRFKEMGIKKTLGAGRGLLTWQLMGESVVICWLSLIFGLILLEALSPVINPLLGSNISSTILIHSTTTIVLLIAGATLLGILTGLLPAMYLAKTNTINALKNELSSGRGAITLRSAMIVFQFSIAITLIITSIGIYSQVQYMLKKNLGFNPENVCYIDGNRSLNASKKKLLKEKLRACPAIKDVALISQVPGEIGWQESFSIHQRPFQYTFLAADPELFDVLEIPIIKGENFSSLHLEDQDSCMIINQNAKDIMGVKAGDIFIDDQGKAFKILGEVNDFNFNSLKQSVPPLIIFPRMNAANHLLIRFEKGKIVEGLNFAKKAWEELVPDYPFTPVFLSTSIKELYTSERKLGSLILFFTMLALVIAAMGLYGLSTFLVNKRKREIGLRKVMGASNSQIRKRISFDFLKWVLFSNIIAYPISYLMVNYWLERFAYRTTISPTIFVAGTVLSALVALVTVYWQISQTVRLNPAQTLKHE